MALYKNGEKISKIFINGEEISKMYKGGELIYQKDEALKIVDFATGTDKQIAKMLEAHYNGEINISDYWHVGDTRVVHIEATNSGTADYIAQDMPMVIMDFDHDDLTTPINGKTKAAVSVGFENLLSNNHTIVDEYYWGSSYTPVQDSDNYSISPLRTWLNGELLNAMTSTFSSLIKEVNKKNLAYHTKTDGAPLITQDKIWLMSYPEVFGSQVYSGYLKGIDPGNWEGTQYEYMKDSTNRVKYLNKSDEYRADTYNYWLRSPSSSSTSTDGYRWCYVEMGGSIGNKVASPAVTLGRFRESLSPAFCL